MTLKQQWWYLNLPRNSFYILFSAGSGSCVWDPCIRSNCQVANRAAVAFTGVHSLINCSAPNLQNRT